MRQLSIALEGVLLHPPKEKTPAQNGPPVSSALTPFIALIYGLC